MALILGVKIGDVVDIAENWIAVLSVDGRGSATLITSGGEKVPVYSEYETEMVPGVWVHLGPTTAKLQLLFEAPKMIPIDLRRKSTG